jgi:hypothetical protein
MAYHFFSIKKNDVRILWDADETDLLRKDADYTDFNYSKAASFVKVLNFDKAIKRTKRKNPFQSASSR